MVKKTQAKGRKTLPKKPRNKASRSSKKNGSWVTRLLSFKRRLLVFVCKWSIIGMIWAGIVAIMAIFYFAHDLPDIRSLHEERTQTRITVLSDTGDVLSSYGQVRGYYVAFDQFPNHLIEAVLATEDRRFFSHFGIDMVGLLRAFYVNFQAGRIKQGGSTISQQLAKILFLTPDRTIKRKIQEMLLALWLEQRFDKEDILTIYLNRVYLGAGNYGMDHAARYYFGVPVSEVNLQQAALLAGLLKAPSRYAPTSNPKRAAKRANQVLRNMVKAGYITNEQAITERYTERETVANVKGSLKNPYFSDWVVERLPQKVGNISLDVTITTTLDTKIQQHVEKAIQEIFDPEAEARNMHQLAVVVMTKDGALKAMVGGRSYKESQFNRAVKAKRQPGSLFKLFVYLAGLEHGYTPDQKVVDAPIEIGSWKPQNYNGIYQGEMLLKEALARSINTIAVALIDAIGPDKVVDMAHRLGVTEEILPVPSIALGAAEMRLLEMVQAYAHLANNGNKVRAYAIKEITDTYGVSVYQYEAGEELRILSKKVTADMNRMLIAAMQEGTGRNARIPYSAAGKTGTSQDFRDAWFVGYTTEYVVGVWVGNDDNSPMENITGGSIPATLWRNIMEEIMDGKTSIPIAVSERMMEGEDTKSIWGRWFNNASETPEVEYQYPGKKRR